MTVLPFPKGDNLTDTVISDVHFNLTALNINNYTLYSNQTLSNNSDCHLVLPPHTPPTLYPNGTFPNATSCYAPILPISTHSTISILFSTFFALTLLITLVSLRKQGANHLPSSSSTFRHPITRRWPFYFALSLSATGLIATITAVDVDRDYLPSTPLILRSFFLTLQLPLILATVWESLRAHRSRLERLIADADPFAFRAGDRRTKIQFWIPLLVYLFVWLTFFMTIPRAWNPITKQNDEAQTRTIAEPSATDARFKTGAVFATLAWLLISSHIFHIAHFYSSHLPHLSTSSPTTQRSANALLKPLVLCIAALPRVAYALFSSFSWPLSPFNLSAPLGLLFGLGYGPPLFVLLIINLFALQEPNEDVELARRRRERGERADVELGVRRKPAWWRMRKGTASGVMGKGAGRHVERLRDLVAEENVGGRKKGERKVKVNEPGKDPFADPSPELPTATEAQNRAEGRGSRRRRHVGSSSTSPSSSSSSSSSSDEISGSRSSWWWPHSKEQIQDEKEERRIHRAKEKGTYKPWGASLLETSTERDSGKRGEEGVGSGSGREEEGVKRTGPRRQGKGQVVRSMLDL
ncbi:MAG: hypothetical protein Q9227_006838 [Pyrenula ochraceoflavens]